MDTMIYLSGRSQVVLDQSGSSSAQAVMQELTSLQNDRYFGILSEYGKPVHYANLDRLAKEGKNIDENTFEEKSGIHPTRSPKQTLLLLMKPGMSRSQ